MPAAHELDHDVRARVHAAVRRWGAHATSFPLLEDGLSYWFDEQGGVVAFVRSGSVRVVAGPPVAPPGSLGAVAARFVRDARRAGDRVAFFWVDDDFVAALAASLGDDAFSSIPIGSQPEWDPRAWSTDGPAKSTLRAQIRRAARKGVAIARIDPAVVRDRSSEERRQLERVVESWLRTRAMHTMRFLVDVQPFGYAEERRYYLAMHGGRAVAALVAVPIPARGGWFFEDVLRAPGAPNGTVELLVDAAMRDAREGGALLATLGLAPLARIPQGRGPHRTLRRALGFCYRRLGVLYPFATLAAFKQRLAPDAWRSQHLVVVPRGAPAVALAHVLHAFTGTRMTAFALATASKLVARVPGWARAVAVAVIAALLVPWTIALAHADAVFWFHSARVQSAWVAFDAFMIVALAVEVELLGVGRMRAARLVAASLASATAVDFALTTMEVATMHPHDHGWLRVIALAAVAGPFVATLVLSGIAAVPVRDRAT